MIEQFEFKGAEDGPTIVFLGRVHGNEPVGMRVLRAFITAVEAGALTLRKGRVLVAPLCNPKAAEMNQRQVDRNLNRLLFPKETPIAYEDHLDNALCPILDQADYLVDLHSFTDPGIPYVLTGVPTARDIDFAKHLGLEHMVHGWAEAYINSGGSLDPLEHQGTTEYARLNGRTPVAVTVECGQHDDPACDPVGRAVVYNALKYLGMIDGPPETHPAPKLHHITRTFFKAKEGDFVKSWRNMESIKQDEVLARYNDGDVITAPEDGLILLTKPWAKVGGEWFCIGKTTSLSL